jgi:23S rRNA pseudouridine1911/1915/1917 synthase
VAAKTDAAHQGLAVQLSEHSMARVYHAVAIGGNFTADDFTIDKPVGRHPVDRKRMAVVSRGGKRAVTHIHILERFKGFAYVQARLETGRTHQIRVHMAYIGHPLLGDEVYGKPSPLCEGGQMLHAKCLGFIHPITGEYLYFDTELPAYFTKVLDVLRRR